MFPRFFDPASKSRRPKDYPGVVTSVDVEDTKGAEEDSSTLNSHADGIRTTSSELVDESSLKSMTIIDLKNLCQQQGLLVTGNKSALIQRLSNPQAT